MVPHSHPSDGLKPNWGWLAAIVAMAEEAVEMQFIMGNPGFPALLSACLASPTALIAP
jgi:hypothetical protein